MIHRNVFHNDRIVPIEQIRLSPGQAGLMSGWGLFTTLRIFQGEAFAYELHWERLERDANRTRMPFPFDAAQVRRHLGELLKANEVVEGTARIYMIYNRTGFWQSNEPMPQVDLILYTAGLPAHPEHGRLGLAKHGRHAASPLAGVKVTSWLNNVWHLSIAQEQELTEVILLNERGEVAECTAANIFSVRKGVVSTPPLSSGCLKGVTRSVLLEIGPDIGVPIYEQTLTAENLYLSEEIFITSTNRGVLGINEIAGHTYAGAPGPVTKKLETEFNATMREYVANRAAELRTESDLTARQ